MNLNNPQQGFSQFNFTALGEQEMRARSAEFYQRMRGRRSIREFSAQDVPLDIINNAIHAAGTAPSGANRQPWHFAVVSSQPTKIAIRQAAEAEEKKFYHDRASAEWLRDLAPLGTDEHKPFLDIAPHLIVVFLKKFTIDDNGVKHKNYYTAESVGIATGMLITALHLSGLVTLTHTPSPMKFLNKILQRPDTEKPFLILVVGYPAEGASVPRIDKYPLVDITSYF